MMDLFGIRWDGERFHFLEQTLLPHEETIIQTRSWETIVDAIRRLAIRGAPAIGVSGAYAAVCAYREYENEPNRFFQALEVIEHARPTAVNLSFAVNRLRSAIRGIGWQNTFRVLEKEANAIAEEDRQHCEAMSLHGLELLPDHARVLTHCNTGFLVSYGIGTALGVLRKGFEEGKLAEVYACEARPLCQGSRLTIWELDKLGIPSTLLCDSAAGRLMEQGKIDLVMLGADRITATGDTANKVGTLNLAILASYYEIPFYVVAPGTTIDITITTGKEIPVEHRSVDEVRFINGKLNTVEDARVFNPAFDVTPSSLITAIITENGIYHSPYHFG